MIRVQVKREKTKTPAVIIAGWSGSGKTTLVEKLLPELKKKQLKVGTLKHHHGALELDEPGKDSWRHRQAGADKTIIAAPRCVAVVMNVDHEPILDELMPYMSDMDLVVVEGYKKEPWPKIEIFRSEVHEKPGFLDDPDLIAIASDTSLNVHVPIFDLNNPDKLAEFIMKHFDLKGC
jgi:molybdopterin-guanine dinucleotide biosynthesis adapter protein